MLKLKQWFSLNIFEKEEDRRMAHIQLTVILISWLASLLVLFIDLVWWGTGLATTLVLGITLQFFPLGLLLQKKLSTSIYISTGIYILLATTLATIGQGVHDYVVMVYPIIILFAGLTAQKRGLFFSTLLTLLAFAWLTLGEANGLFIVQPPSASDWTDLLVAGILIVVAAWAVHILVSNTQYGLAQTWRDLAEYERTELKLRKFSRAVEQSPASIVITDLKANIEYVNLRFTQVTGYGFDEVIGKNPRILKTNLTPPDMYRQLWETITAGKEWRGEFVNRKKDGSLYYESAIISPIIDSNGDPLYYLAVKENITERKQAERALRESEARFRSLFEQNHDAVFILDLNGRYLMANQRAEEMLGYTTEEITQLSIHATSAEMEKSMDVMKRLLSGNHIPLYERFFRKKDGQIIPVEINAALVHDKNGSPLHIQSVARNISERKRTDTLLQMRLDLLEFAASHSIDEVMQNALDAICLFTDSNIGFYHFVESDQKTFSLQACSTRTLNEFYKAKDKSLFYNVNDAGIWAECIRLGKPVIHNDYTSLSNCNASLLVHVEITRELAVPVFRSGSIVSILGIGNKISDYMEQDAEAASYLADVVWEIIKRKQTEQSLNEIQSRLHLLGDNLEEAALYVYSHDADGQVRFEYLSAGMGKITGLKINDVLQDASRLHATILPEYLPRLVELETKSKQDLSSFEMEICQRHAVSGEVYWVLLRSTPRRRPDGSTVWYGVQIDITERKRNERIIVDANEQLRLHVQKIEQLHIELYEQAVRDPLTGLHNRRYMQDVIKREFSRAEREKYSISVIMVDLDELKKINDTYGHRIGDRAIQAIASCLQNMIRAEDFCCRYGGDEFIVILNKATPADALKRVQEWREFLNEHLLDVKGENKIQIKFTAGAASFPAHGTSMDEVINYADVALYRAKAQGRNCTILFE